MTDYTIFDGIQLKRDGIDPEQWPKLSCSQANQTALENSDLRLDANKEIFFQDNGQIRSFDDQHKLVFNRQNDQLELHEFGDICFLTGGSSPTEKMRIRADGNVGVGITDPQAKLDVAGNLHVAENLQVEGEIQNTTLSAVIKQLMDKFDALQRELQAKTAEINRMNTELEATKKELQNTKTELENTKKLLAQTAQTANTALAQAQSAQNTANSAHNGATAAQNTANTARSEIASLRDGIENGSVIAQKAIMLRARDNNHWMRCRGVDNTNHDIFELWRNDGQWFSTIRVEAAIKLRARNDNHWMRFHYTDSANYDIFALWSTDNLWYRLIRV